ncbi:MAG: hypothetical protein E6G25_08115 [Actinobacteria bacterium]|nr:MAG: hypothetical protein E6G25_08115 [Actinomycetota bacterium]
MRAAVREHGEARLVADETVVADVGGSAGDFACGRIAQEGRGHELAFLEVVDRAQVDLIVVLVLEDRRDREADNGHGDNAGDHAPEAERRPLEEDVAREALARLRRRHRRLAPVGRHGRRAFGGRLGAAHRGLRADVAVPIVAGHVAHPEEAEDERDPGADGHSSPTDNQADEDADDADREADRPQAWRRKVRFALALLGLHPRAPPFSRSPGRIQSPLRHPRQRRNR